MKKIAVLLILLVAITSVPAVSWAASAWTQETTYQGKMLGKLKFGLKNALGGWTALFNEPVKHYKDHKGAGHVIEGIASGFSRAIVYSVGGLLHVGTFPVTNLDVPLLDGGVELPFWENKE